MEFAERVLRDAGYRTTTATTAFRAISLLEAVSLLLNGEPGDGLDS